jgi:hypothetical protein
MPIFLEMMRKRRRGKRRRNERESGSWEFSIIGK